MRNFSKAIVGILLATQVNNPLVGANTALAAGLSGAESYEVSLQTNTSTPVVIKTKVLDYENDVLKPLHEAQAAKAAADAAAAEAAAKAAAEAAAAAAAAAKTVTYSYVAVALPAGSHTDWMAAAGIAESDYGYVDYIISHESGWGVTKWNYSGSGAYGLAQALPASKMAAFGDDYMTNPITQLKWANSYAVSRYGSWANAYNFWITNHWW